MKKSNVVLGVLAGAAIGALLGILFAPDIGTKTRKKLYRKGEVIVGDLKEKAHDLTEKANELSRKATRLMEKVNSSVDHAKHEANDLAETAKKKFSDLKHRES
ncbi:MAG: YtxH domain-containing protein [Saprospiraceae bacterium]|nr:YtxH domain-containing protein [Saprospiraceae bacterium]